MPQAVHSAVAGVVPSHFVTLRIRFATSRLYEKLTLPTHEQNVRKSSGACRPAANA